VSDYFTLLYFWAEKPRIYRIPPVTVVHKASCKLLGNLCNTVTNKQTDDAGNNTTSLAKVTTCAELPGTGDQVNYLWDLITCCITQHQSSHFTANVAHNTNTITSQTPNTENHRMAILTSSSTEYHISKLGDQWAFE